MVAAGMGAIAQARGTGFSPPAWSAAWVELSVSPRPRLYLANRDWWAFSVSYRLVLLGSHDVSVSRMANLSARRCRSLAARVTASA